MTAPVQTNHDLLPWSTTDGVVCGKIQNLDQSNDTGNGSGGVT